MHRLIRRRKPGREHCSVASGGWECRSLPPVFPSDPGLELLDSLPPGAQHGLAVAAQPAVQQRGVNAAEVEVELQVADVEVRQAGMPADDAAFDRWSGHEQARGSAMIGALAAV